MIVVDTTLCQSIAYRTDVDLSIPFVSNTTVINGKRTVYYELHVVNFAQDTLDLQDLTIFMASDSSIIQHWNKTELSQRFLRIGQLQHDTSLLLPPGGCGVVFVEAALVKNQKKIVFTHRLAFAIIKFNQQVIRIVDGVEFTVPNGPLDVIGPPLRSGPWAAVYDPAWARGHRRVFYTEWGKARIPGRFAIDFIQLNNSGKYAVGDEDSISNWYGYGAEVLAVGDGVVASVRDKMAESPSISGCVQATAENATGNYISIKLAENRYVFYEHLKPGSISVKPGQIVKKGQMIGAIGFTGQTTGPHLHLHMSDTDSPLGGEGLPFEIDQFTRLGTYPDFSDFGKKTWLSEKTGIWDDVREEHPYANSVIRFPF